MFSNSRQMMYRDFSPALKLIFALATIFLAGFITYESLIAVDAEPITNHVDKLVHLGAYFVLGVVTLPALSRMSPLWVCLGLSLFGVTIEIAQGVMGIGRSADYLDGLANMGGAFLAILAWAIFSALRHRQNPASLKH